MRIETANKLLDQVKRNYEEIAESFDTTRKKEIWPEAKGLAGGVETGKKVLDAGCGNGRLAAAFKSGVDYLGVDNSENLIRLARQNNPKKNFQVLDILSLGALPEKFDYIFCLAVLQHLPSRELRLDALKLMKGRLVPGGKIIMSNWNLWSPIWKKPYRSMIIWTWLKRIFQKDYLDFGDIVFSWKNTHGQSISLRYYHAFTERELRSLARGAGLRVASFKKDPHNYWLILN